MVEEAASLMLGSILLTSIRIMIHSLTTIVNHKPLMFGVNGLFNFLF